MKGSARQDKALLLATAKALAAELKKHIGGTALRIRVPARVTITNTDGWEASLGNLGKNKPRLELWLDRFSGYHERKFFACFRSEARPPMMEMTRRVARTLWPTRIVTPKDTDDEEFLVLAQRLGRSEFNRPILEKYSDGLTYFGIYDPTRESSSKTNTHFVNRAAAFFLDVARALPNARVEDEESDIYPHIENRKSVVSHLRRERSRLLALDRKKHDGYVCQVCEFRFEDGYGKLGIDFAEAHHLVPLSKLHGTVQTRMEDLRTVCANCHRMLHRMKGERGDIAKLKGTFRRHRAKRR